MQERALPAGGAHKQRPGIVEVKITLEEQPAAADGRKVGLEGQGESVDELSAPYVHCSPFAFCFHRTCGST